MTQSTHKTSNSSPHNKPHHNHKPNLKPLYLLSSLSLSLIHLNTYALDKLKVDQVNASLFEAFFKLIDSNIGMIVAMAAVFSAVMRDGDFMQRAKASAIGTIGTLAIWGAGKKMIL